GEVEHRVQESRRERSPPGSLVREQVVLISPECGRRGARPAPRGRGGRRQLRREGQSTRLRPVRGKKTYSRVARLTSAAIGDAPRDLTASSVASPSSV